MIVDLASINRVLGWLGLVLVVHQWDGQGEREMPRDRTRLELMTERAHVRRCVEYAKQIAERGAA